jgi:hypothetical protein
MPWLGTLYSRPGPSQAISHAQKQANSIIPPHGTRQACPSHQIPMRWALPSHDAQQISSRLPSSIKTNKTAGFPYPSCALSTADGGNLSFNCALYAKWLVQSRFLCGSPGVALSTACKRPDANKQYLGVRSALVSIILCVCKS